MRKDAVSPTAAGVAPGLTAWRTRALNSLLIVTSIAATGVMVSIILDAIDDPEFWPATVAYLVLYLFLLGLTVLRRLNFHLRAWGLLLAAYAAGVLAFARGGLAGDGRVYLLALPLMTLILVGRRGGLFMGVLSVLTFAAFGVTAHLKWMAEWLVCQDNTLLWSDWGIGGVAFVMVLAALMALQWRFSQAQQAVAAENLHLYEESERLRAFNENIVQGMEEGILLEDATGHIRFVNHKAAELLNCTPEELKGRHWTAIVAPECVTKVEEETARRFQGVTSRCETKLLTRGGERVPVIVSARPLFEGGRFDGVLSVFADIAERKQAEEMLRESEERLRAVVENMPVMMDAFDADLNVVTWNRECERVTGYSAREIIGNPKALDLLYPDADYLERMLAEWGKRGDFRDWESKLTCKDGSVRTVAWSNISRQYPIPGWAAWAVGVDITAQKQAEQQAIRSERLAAMGHIAAELAHETNSPLQAVRSNLELLLTFDLAPDEHRQRLGIILEEIERLIESNRRVLDFARPAEETRYPVSIADLVRKTLTFVDRQAQSAHVQVNADLPADLPAVFAAPNQIAQVLLNLSINAIEAMSDGGYFKVTAHVDGDSVVLVFANDGPHLTPEQAEQLFDPFFTTKPGNTGLGLSISHSIIEQHRGTIRVENLDGKRGVAFTITLPVASASKEKQ
jgi:PAS domain S-box-containing protein